jgi:DNA-binding transcriptional MerR regulator
VGTIDLGGTSRDGFSIGEAAAIVGVSTHVLRSWERRLSLALNHRTRSNQRRYWLEDVQRFAAIRKLHVAQGLPLIESAARALNARADAWSEATRPEPAGMLDFWARLLDSLPAILLVLDEAGKVISANAVARAKLNVRLGASFTRFAPGGWRQTYQALRRAAGTRRQPTILAMRSRSGILFVDASLMPLGRMPESPVVVVGQHVRDRTASASAGQRLRAAGA